MEIGGSRRIIENTDREPAAKGGQIFEWAHS